MPIFVDIPGVGEVEFPDEMSELEIAQESQKLFTGVVERPISPAGDIGEFAVGPPTPPPEDIGAGPAAGRFASKRLVDNLAAFPRLAGKVLAGGAAGLDVLTSPSTFEAISEQGLSGLGKSFDEAYAIQQALEPAATLRESDFLPDTADLIAGGQAGRETFTSLFNNDRRSIGERFDEARTDVVSEFETIQEQHPIASAVGTGLGDAATLITGRAAPVRGMAQRRIAQREELIKAADNVPSNIKNKLTDVISANLPPFLKESAERLTRATGKATGVGLEGAALAMLNDNDPIAADMFKWGAGLQANASLALFVAEKPLKRLLPFVGAAWLAAEMFKAAAPGDQDFFESKDFAVQKAVLFLTGGALFGLAGGGRLRGPTADKFPVWFDAVNAVPRGVLLSRLQELKAGLENGDGMPLAVMSEYSTNPSYFGSENIQERMGRALNSENPGDFTEELNRMMESMPDFRARIDALLEEENE